MRQVGWFLPWVALLLACGGATPEVQRPRAEKRAGREPVKGKAPVVASRPKPGEPGSDQVTLAFAWPHGMSASVRVTHKRQRDQEQARSTITYNVGVAETDAGRKISYSAYMPYLRVPGALPTEQHGMRQRMAKLMPGLTTDARGQLTGVQGMDRTSARHRLRALRVGRAQHKAASHALLNEQLMAAAERFWYQRVGRWQGVGKLDQGQEQQAAETMVVAELDGTSVDAITKFAFVGWAKCSEGDAQARCVEIHLETRPDAEAMDEAVRQYTKKRRRSRDGPIVDVEKRTHVELITDPKTLRPHRFSEDRFTMVSRRDRSGNEVQSMTMDSLIEVYTYSLSTGARLAASRPAPATRR